MRAPVLACVVALVAWAGTARASCESILIAQSRDLDFWYTDATSDSGPVPRAHYDGLAHGLATAFHAWERVERDACEAATPRRIKLHLQAGSTLATTYDRGGTSPEVLATFAGADSDSTCMLWTCALATFRDHGNAVRLLARLPAAEVSDSLTETFDPEGPLHWYYSSCVATIEVSGFVVITGRNEQVCHGLFFSRYDAERGAERLAHEIHLRPELRQIRVDGALLANILHEY